MAKSVDVFLNVIFSGGLAVGQRIVSVVNLDEGLGIQSVTSRASC